MEPRASKYNLDPKFVMGFEPEKFTGKIKI